MQFALILQNHNRKAMHMNNVQGFLFRFNRG